MLNKKKKLLFSAYGGGHIKVLLPIVEELLQTSDEFEPQVLAFTTARTDCRARGIPCKTMLDFSYLFPPEAIEIGKKLAEELPYKAIDFEESAAYLGISFSELSEELGYDAACKAYNEKGRSIFCPVKAMEKILTELKPSILITTNSPRCEMALLKAASNLGIPSICVVDFYINKTASWLAEDWCGKRICVLDKFVEQQLINIGRNPEHIVITGNPAFDHYGKEISLEKANKYRKDNIANHKRLIAYASTSWIESTDTNDKLLKNDILDFLIKECTRLGYILSHRQHPGEPRTQRPSGVLNGNDVPLETFMSSADLIITFPSTIIYEGRVLGIPTLALGMSELVKQSNYLIAGNYKIVYNFQEIREILESLKEIDEYSNRKLSSFNKATDLVIEEIKKIACN
jgi:predicted glycosyltransferase